MSRILYISLTGMTEPLGESQVVQYLLELAKEHDIYLISFEKPCEVSKIETVRQRLNAMNIHWRYFSYSNKYGVFSSVFQIVRAFFTGCKIVKQQKIQIVHTRSIIPAVIGLLLKKRYKVKFLFDIRGFAIEEKADDGRIKRNSWLYKVLTRLEAYLYKNADHVVTLTHASKPIIQEMYQLDADTISVISTCVNTKMFRFFPPADKLAWREQLGFSAQDIIVVHNGTVGGGWFDFDAEVKLFKKLLELQVPAKFLILNRHQHHLIYECLQKHGVEEVSYKVMAVNFEEMVCYLNVADLAFFFLKPVFSKQASAPTKLGEYIACRLFSVANEGYGDIKYYFDKYNQVGMLFKLEDIHEDTERVALEVLNYLRQRHEISAEQALGFSQLLDEHFSKDVAIKNYGAIYQLLTGMSL